MLLVHYFGLIQENNPGHSCMLIKKCITYYDQVTISEVEEY